MSKIWDFLDGKKSYSALAIMSSAALLCPILGVPAGITAGIVAAGTALGIIGRIHAGAKLGDETAKVIELKVQLEALKQYVATK